MSMTAIPEEIARKIAKLEALAQRVGRHPGLLPEVFAGLGATPARVKYGCLKLLRTLSESRPDLLYPEMGRLVQLLRSENQIMKWGAILMLGNLAAVDSERKIDGILAEYLQPISGPVMITAANVIHGAGKIAQAKPYLADRIAQALLRVEAANYQTAECHNVALGHAVASLESFFGQVQQRAPVVDFVRRQLDNPRNAVKRKAARFLKRCVPAPEPAARPRKTVGKSG
jgi:hypothetical protein